MVLIDSVSKRYSECGIRIGALITKNKELRAAVMKFCQARLSPPLLGQIVAVYHAELLDSMGWGTILPMGTHLQALI